MTKQFSFLQLFSLVDGRLSTSMDDVYDMLNHICDDNLMTHHLPVAGKYLKETNPIWYQDVTHRLISMGITKERPFEVCIELVKENNHMYDIPQLKDEFDTSNFIPYMLDNSLLLGKEDKIIIAAI